MCLYPRLILNRKYSITKKNKGIIPECEDMRTKYVPVGCGQCIECRKQKKREWQIRLTEELKRNPDAIFITLTFGPDELKKLTDETKRKECNATCKIAVRRFLERWRKKYKKSVKHWLITELGHEGTERIHMHGILWTKEDHETIREIWKYGNIWIGKYCSEKTINYIVKYVTKVDTKNKNYKQMILTSPGIGRGYESSINGYNNRYKKDGTIETYRLNNGAKVALPIYYRNKIYTEEEKTKLWIEKLDKGEIYVCGIKCDVSTEKGIKEYYNILNTAREKNKRLGYGDDSKEWKKKDYNVTLRMLQKKTKKEIDKHVEKYVENHVENHVENLLITNNNELSTGIESYEKVMNNFMNNKNNDV